MSLLCEWMFDVKIVCIDRVNSFDLEPACTNVTDLCDGIMLGKVCQEM
jgi:hypothetical protein